MKIKDKDFECILNELFQFEEVKSLENYEHHRVTNRLNHSIDVAYKSYILGKRIGLDSSALKEIARAGLLHDFFFYDTKIEKHKGHLGTHPMIALENAMKIVNLTDKEKDIILSHMFGVSFKHIPKYKESLIVSLVDKYVSINEVCNRVVNKQKQIVILT